jgi:hypothetical protein
MKTLFGKSIHSILFFIGGIFLFIAAVTLISGLISANRSAKNGKPVTEIEYAKSVSVISASVCFSVSIVLICTGIFVYFNDYQNI